jgi:hypothetical protein
VLTVLTGAFSVSLFFFKVGVLGWVATDVASFYQTVWEELALGV